MHMDYHVMVKDNNYVGIALITREQGKFLKLRFNMLVIWIVSFCSFLKEEMHWS